MAEFTSKYKELQFRSPDGQFKKFKSFKYSTKDKSEIDLLKGLRDTKVTSEEKPKPKQTTTKQKTEATPKKSTTTRKKKSTTTKASE